MARRKARKVSRKPRRRRAGVRRRRTSAKRRRVTRGRTRFTGRGRVVFTNPRARARRYCRNPGFGGLFARFKDAGIVAGGVIVGRGLTNYGAAMIPIGMGNTFLVAAKKLGVGGLLALVAEKAVGRKMADAMLAGSVLAAVDPFLAGIPIIGSTGLARWSGPTLGLYAPARALPSGASRVRNDPYMAFASPRRA